MRIKADSLLYNMLTQKINFIGPTHIKSKDGNIFTTQGNYDLNNGSAFFGNRTLVKDSSGRTYQANNMALDDKTGQAQLEGNAIIKDSVNRFIATGNQIFLSKKNNSFLATKKPVIIIWQGKDTTYISGDTLFSGFTKRVYNEDIGPADNAVSDASGKDSLQIKNIKKDSSKVQVVRKSKAISRNKEDTTIRYFIAYHNVKIFNDSLQSVSDSLFYSGADSVFRLFYNPVIWSGKNQVSGDTIYLFTKNQKAERVSVFENGMMLNKIKGELYNQVAGKTINGYFKNGEIEYIKVKGSPAESIYYVQDQDSAFAGMNHADGSVIDMYFNKQQLNTVKFLNDVHGKLYPIRQIPQDQKYLKGFIWLDKRRPKNKLELFE
jgi:lipopolysaccharide export system protein LptA